MSPRGLAQGPERGSTGPLCWDLDRGKGAAGGGRGRGLLSTAGSSRMGSRDPAVGCCTAQSQPPPVGQPRLSSPRRLWRQSGVRRGPFAPSGRVAVLSGFAFSLLQPGSGQAPFPEDSQVRSCPAPCVARIHLGFSCAIQVWRWWRRPSPSVPIPLRSGEKDAAGRR